MQDPQDARFLLIKPWGFGFWSDMEDVQSKLLLAEITNRIPIVFWGKDSLYSVGDNINSFEQYFLPVSDYSIKDVVSDNYTFYPPIWNSSNIVETDPNRFSRVNRDVSSFVNCDANVLVSDVHNFIYEFAPWINEGHPAYGLKDVDIYHTNIETESLLDAYRYVNKKYIKLQPDIAAEIDEFYHAHLETGPILAVHIRGGVKLNEDPYWGEVMAQYPYEINCYLKDNPSARIFLLTDDDAILAQFRHIYGDILIYTDCNRKSINDEGELCLKLFPDRRRKGIEIIKDSYLACKCDYFIGNWGSNVFRAVKRLKVWETDKIKMVDNTNSFRGHNLDIMFID